jgi:RNA polymerase sigma-70 factor (ECF subfamily)
VKGEVIPLQRLSGSPEELSDEALVAVCALGEPAALGALYDRHVSGTRRFLARLGAHDRDLDDLVQTTFEAVASAAKHYDGRSSVRTWLFGIANNKVRHQIRAEGRRERLGEAVTAERSRSGDASADMLAREHAAHLQNAIADLPSKLRQVFVLVYLEGVSGVEVARLVGVREGTIWKRLKRLHQARGLLRDALEGVWP